MPVHPIRYVQCPYCKKKFGVQQDQAVASCFYCGGRLDLQPKIRKPSAFGLLAGALLQRAKRAMQERRAAVKQTLQQEEAFFEESVPPFTEEPAAAAMDDYHFDPVEQMWVAPDEPGELVFLDEEIEYFDPVASLRSEMPYEEALPAEVENEPLDPIEQLRYAASRNSGFETPEKPRKLVPRAGFERRKWMVIGGVIVVVVVVILLLIIITAAMR
jgi:DNA-directed RNA polymerase subunit RPC12/RpoP